MIDLAVVGCGAITRTCHIPAILLDPKVHLKALVDPDPTVLDNITRCFKITPIRHTSLAELKSVTAAIVAVPPHLHAAATIHLLSRGIHVLCEKPIATNTSDAEKMIAEATRTGTVLAIGFMKRFYPNTYLLKDSLENGDIGTVASFKLTEGFRSNWDTRNAKRFDPAFVPGGVLYESGVHWIDRLTYWFGEPHVIRYEDDRLGGVEANAYLELEYVSARGIVRGTIRLSWTNSLENTLEVFGSEGRLILADRDPSSVVLFRQAGRSHRRFSLRDEARLSPLYPFERQLDAFGQAIAASQPDRLANGHDGLRALEILETAYSKRTDLSQPWVFSGLLKHTAPRVV